MTATDLTTAGRRVRHSLDADHRGTRGLATELAIALVVLAALAVAILGGHLWHGGLYTDDWPIADIYLKKGGLGELIHALFYGDHSRPLAAVYLGFTEAAVGTSGTGHAIVGMTTHVLACWALYWLMRELAMRWWQAAAVAVLVLLIPIDDSIWLWFAVNQGSLSLAFAAFGMLALLHAMRTGGARSVWLHALAVVLMAASVLTYEAAAATLVVAAVVLGLAHARRQADAWRPTMPVLRSAAQALPSIVAVVLAAAVPRIHGLLPGIDPHTGLTRSQELSHAKTMAGQAGTVLANSAVPFGYPHRNVVLPVLAVIVVTALVAWWRAPRSSEQAAQLRLWLAWLLCGAVVVATAYLVFVNTDLGFYEPLSPGSNNRINVVAAVGYCIALVAVAMLVATLVGGWARALARPPLLVAVACGALVVALAVGYAIQARRDVRGWDRAASDQRAQLATLQATVPRPAHGTTLYVLGGVGQTEVDVFSFGVTWDLNNAVKLRYGDSSLNAYPIFAGSTFVCGPGSMYPSGFINGNNSAQSARYGHALVIDLRTRRRLSIGSRADCRRAQRTFVPGPVTG